MKPATVARFWSLVHGAGYERCWLWQGAADRYGYGKFFFSYSTVSAHTFAYEHMVHGVPVGLELDHLCRTRLCVNPWHLEPVTHQINMARKVAFAAMDPATQFCANGHLRDAGNTYISPSGHKNCRPCNRAAQARRKARKRATS